MKRFGSVLALLAALLLLGASVALAQGGTVTLHLYHFSDYHSHAVPFYSEGKPDQAGIARTVGFLRGKVLTDPNAIVFSGGDTMNTGSPSWSDKYTCSEWDWFNGIVEAMAVGNHEFDYGPAAFEQCRAKADYPLISANLVISDTAQPYLTANGKPYVIVERGGVRLGVFAVADPSYRSLVRATNLPKGTRWADATETAKEMVRRLREDEKVNAVISIGHQEFDNDVALAKAVPGIDVILGTHSHLKKELQRIPGTATWYIEPYQYLTYLSNVNLQFNQGRLVNVSGGLVKMDETIPEAPDVKEGVAARIATMKADPLYAPKFQKIGSAAVELSNDNLYNGESVIGNFVMDLVRQKAAANLALSTASSFRASIPPGDMLMEDYLAALPFKNFIMITELTGAQVRDLLNLSVSKRTTDNFSQQSGARFTIRNGQAQDIQILKDPADPAQGYEALDDTKTYKVATTDYQANVQADYRAIFNGAASKTNTGIVINDLVIDYIKANSPVSAQLDGRIK